MLLPPYTTGTITVSGGSTIVVGATMAWTDLNAREGDWLRDPATGYTTVITGRTDATHLTVPAWRGSAVAAGAYEIYPYSSLRYAGGTALADVAALLAILNGSSIFYVVVGDEPDPSIGENNQYALKTNSGAWQLWLKTGGVWVLQSQPVGLTYRGEWSSATSYVANDRVSRNGSTYIAKQPSTNQAPEADVSATYWDTAGVKGDPGTNGAIWFSGAGVPSSGTGANGDFYLRTSTFDVYTKSAGSWSVLLNIKGATGAVPVISGTSTSLIVVGSGSKSFSTQTGLAWSVGQRLRAVNAGGDRVMVGPIESYSGTTLTIAVDDVQGLGSDSNWTITVAGEKGQTGGSGPSGSTGTKGDKGDTGLQGAASTVPGPKGDTGTGLSWSASGTFAQRSTYDGQTTGFGYLETDTAPFQFWVKASNTSADWAGPTYIGGQAAVGDMGLITDSILDQYDYGSIAA